MSADGPRPHEKRPAPHGNSPWGAGRSSRALLDRLEPTRRSWSTGSATSSRTPTPTTRARTAYPERDRVADEQVSRLRHGASIHAPRVAALVDELTVTAGARVADRLAAVPSLPRRTGVDVVAHPEAGTLRLADETPAMPEADGQRLVVNG
ncbi:hypothetical protein ACFRNJ_04820 [Streptomyces sp. NPDC056721]|uniref:MmyB family transcriptional regulator n=1 Tax=Streptomyces sp. NPDC056721 TaxID=3345923 RepID=UPI00367B4A3B